MKLNLITTLVCLLILVGCKKSETEEDISPIVGTWKRKLIEQRTSATNWKADARTCYQDDIEEFAAGGKWTLYDGTAQCSAGAGMSKGTWRLAVQNTKVIFTYEGASGEYESTVESLTNDMMVLSHSTGDLQNTQIRTTYQK